MEGGHNRGMGGATWPAGRRAHMWCVTPWNRAPRQRAQAAKRRGVLVTGCSQARRMPLRRTLKRPQLWLAMELQVCCMPVPWPHSQQKAWRVRGPAGRGGVVSKGAGWPARRGGRSCQGTPAVPPSNPLARLPLAASKPRGARPHAPGRSCRPRGCSHHSSPQACCTWGTAWCWPSASCASRCRPRSSPATWGAARGGGRRVAGRVRCCRLRRD